VREGEVAWGTEAGVTAPPLPDLIHGLAFVTLLVLPGMVWARWIIAACLLCSLAWYLRRDAWLSMPTSCVALRVEGDHVVLVTRDGKELAGQVQRDSLVSAAVLVLNVLPQGARFARSVVIFPDAIAAEAFRELRVILRWGR
jgi:toxin CptA